MITTDSTIASLQGDIESRLFSCSNQENIEIDVFDWTKYELTELLESPGQCTLEVNHWQADNSRTIIDGTSRLYI